MSMMAFDDETRQVFEVFCAEVAARAKDVERAVSTLEADPTHAESILVILRAAHSIKGCALQFELYSLGGFAHVIEEVFALVRDGSVGGTTELLPLVLRANDCYLGLMQRALQGKDELHREDLQVLLEIRQKIPDDLRNPLPATIENAAKTMTGPSQANKI